MQHAMLIPEIHEFSMLVKMRQRARSLDAFSHLYRDFQYRLISTYTFSESSRHSEHNDMRQGYVLINRLGCRAPWRVRWRHPHVRGRKKLLHHFTALHPRYSYSGGSPGLGTTGKFRQTFIENRTPSQVQDYAISSANLINFIIISWTLEPIVSLASSPSRSLTKREKRMSAL